MSDISPEDLLDDINTDVMTPAWVCFDHEPSEIAKNAYAGLMQDGMRVFSEKALINGNFEVIVSAKERVLDLLEKPLHSVRDGPELELLSLLLSLQFMKETTSI